MQNKNFKNLQRGIAPLLIIAIVAILAVGGGAYVVTKKNAKVNVELEGDANTQANINADINANENANLGVNARGSLRSLLTMARNTTCTFTNTAPGMSSSGTVYISAEGSMRGDITSTSSTGTQASSIIVKDGTTYAWSGTQGVKMDTSASANASASAQSKVDLDSQVDYKCESWTVDSSKFVVPTTVTFVDINAMLKGSGGVNLKLPGQ
jgi:hypothetical protein